LESLCHLNIVFFENNNVIICKKTEAGGTESEGFRVRGRRLRGKGQFRERLVHCPHTTQTARSEGERPGVRAIPSLSVRLVVSTT